MDKKDLIKDDYSLPGFQFKPYQNEAITFGLTKFNVLFNMQPGSGKTLTALGLANRCVTCSSSAQIAILAPKQAVSSFKKELKTRIKASYSIHTAEEDITHANDRYHIFVYSKIEELIKFCYSTKKPIILIIDEVHKLSNDNAVNRKLQELRPRFAFVVGLTGTPLQDKPEGLYNVINFISPGFLKSYVFYSDNFLTHDYVYTRRGGKRVKIKKVTGLKNEETLSKHLQKILFTKVKSYNMDFQYKSCFMTDVERANYVKAAKGVLESEEDEKVFSARLHDLQRVIDGSIAGDGHMSSKEKLLISTLTEIMSRNESTLVYCEYEATYTRLVELLKSMQHIIGYSKIHLITGKIPFKERLKVESDMPLKSIVVMTKAGSASINLQAANNIIFYTVPWSMGDLIQSVGRITRVDTKFDTQHVYFLEVTDTIDSYRRILVESKLGMLQALFGEQPTVPKIEDFVIDKKELKKQLLWKKY